MVLDLALLPLHKDGKDIFECCRALARIFSGYDVDPVFLHQADPLFRYEIMEKGFVSMAIRMIFSSTGPMPTGIIWIRGTCGYLKTSCSAKRWTISGGGWTKPAEVGMVRKEFVKRKLQSIAGSVGLKNILVHDYSDVDRKIVHSSIRSCLRDYQEYVDYVYDFLEKSCRSDPGVKNSMNDTSAIERLWDDLCRKPDDIPSPQWHSEVLVSRENGAGGQSPVCKFGSN